MIGDRPLPRKRRAVYSEVMPAAARKPALPVRPDLPVLVIALAGLVVAGYLAWIKWSGTGALFCTAGSGCDIVQASRYATFLGVPTALWGALVYLALGILALLGLEGGKWRAAFVLASGAVGFSAYLTFLSITQLRATCVYCLVSAGLSALLLVVLFLRRPRAPGGAGGLPPAVLGIGAGVAAIVLGAFIFAAGPEGATPYQLALARHLAQSKAVFYGAYWCPHCQEQKHMFGGAAGFLPYVECDSKGTNAQPERCERAGVRVFPTWDIGGSRREGVQSVEALAEASGFPKS
jgi:uncharacterized membrane protein